MSLQHAVALFLLNEVGELLRVPSRIQFVIGLAYDTITLLMLIVQGRHPQEVPGLLSLLYFFWGEASNVQRFPRLGLVGFNDFVKGLWVMESGREQGYWNKRPTVRSPSRRKVAHSYLEIGNFVNQ